MFTRLIAITLAIAGLAVAANGEESSAVVPGTRQPKLFYISSFTTTSTLSTTTVCYKTKTAITTACKRKRKRDIMSVEAPDLIKPSRNSRMDEEEFEDLLEGGEKQNQRDPKFLLYWATLTSTSTSTSYTATSTIATLECTPSAFGVKTC